MLIIGNLKDWDQTARLGEVTTPTLITVGRYDGQTIACSETLNQGIPDSQMVVFEEVPTLPMWKKQKSIW